MSLSTSQRFVATICAMNQNNAITMSWTHNLFNTPVFDIVDFRTRLQTLIYEEYDWNNENLAFKNEAINLFGTNWKLKVSEAVSWIGLEDTDAYLDFINNTSIPVAERLYFTNIKLKILNSKSTCQ